jgi:Predicted phosphoesterases, related to the Icc protein
MRIVQISDTHSRHHELPPLPEGNVLVHCGDISEDGTEDEVLDFLNWFIELPYAHKIFVCGNHDLCLRDADGIEELPDNVHFLQDCGVTIDGVRFFGIGYDHPESVIPSDTDVVVTHEPPMDILDRTGEISWGNFYLLKRIQEIRPKYHLFGHAHSAQGVLRKDGIVFSNASLMDDSKTVAYQPKVFDF